MKDSSEIRQKLEVVQASMNTVYKPEILRLKQTKDRQRFLELLKQPGLILHDTIQNQLAEWVKFSQPSVKMDAKTIEQKVAGCFGDCSPEEFGTWVYYPWTNRLVHLLDEKEFVDVRTSRNQYKITPEEKQVLLQKKIGVIGLSVGQSVAVTLAMERICGEIRLADFDVLELTNLNRIRTGVHNLGLAKVFSVAREISEIDPYLTVKCFPEGIHDGNMDTFFCEGGKLDLMIEESDGFDIKILSRYKARALKIPVLMEASDRCMVDVERFDLEPDRSILHGLVDHLDIETLKSLRTTEEKIPYMLDVLGIDTASPRLKASMLEIEQSINTWPQLASAVTMGGGITADVARRLLLNQFKSSGRYFVDVEELIGDTPVPKAAPSFPTTLKEEWVTAGVAGEEHPTTIEESEVRELIGQACKAPSFGNSQPWNWTFANGAVYLSIAGQRVMSMGDPQLQNVFCSLGASLENLHLAATQKGYQTNIQYFPFRNNSAAVASVTFTKLDRQVQEPLASYIPLRHTNRSFAKPTGISEETVSRLKAVFGNTPNFEMQLMSDRLMVQQIANVFGAAERFKLLEETCNHEYFGQELKLYSENDPETGYSREHLHAPVAVQYAYTVLGDPKVAKLLREWNKGWSIQHYQTRLVSSSPVLGVITAKSTEPAALLELGRQIQKLWLSAQSFGLAFQPLMSPVYLHSALMNKDKNHKQLDENIFLDANTLFKEIDATFTQLSQNKVVFLFRLFYGDAPAVRTNRLKENSVYTSRANTN